MKIAGSVVFLTGANRGLGRSLARALLARGVNRLYLACRRPDLLSFPEPARERIHPLTLDVTDAARVAALAGSLMALDLVINNAGTMSSFSVLSGPLDAIRADMETNFIGPLLVARALTAALERGSGKTLVNVLSMAALASMPALGGYCASKAAAWSMTQALRGELAPRGIRVLGVLAGPIDTEMIRSLTVPKAVPDEVAEQILAGIERGDEDIAPDPVSLDVYHRWLADPKAIEARFGGRR